MGIGLLILLAWILLGVGALRNFKISIREVRHFQNNDYAKVTHEVRPLDTGDSLSVNVTFKQNLPEKNLKFRIACLKADNDEPFLIDQTVDVCKFLKTRNANPIFLTVFNILRSVGRMPQSCPIRKGTFHVKNFIMDKNTYPAIVPPNLNWVLDLKTDTETVFNMTITIVFEQYNQQT